MHIPGKHRVCFTGFLHLSQTVCSQQIPDSDFEEHTYLSRKLGHFDTFHLPIFATSLLNWARSTSSEIERLKTRSSPHNSVTVYTRFLSLMTFVVLQFQMIVFGERYLRKEHPTRLSNKHGPQGLKFQRASPSHIPGLPGPAQ